jgi:hypothetical protein
MSTMPSIPSQDGKWYESYLAEKNRAVIAEAQLSFAEHRRDMARGLIAKLRDALAKIVAIKLSFTSAIEESDLGAEDFKEIHEAQEIARAALALTVEDEKNHISPSAKVIERSAV